VTEMQDRYISENLLYHDLNSRIKDCNFPCLNVHIYH